MEREFLSAIEQICEEKGILKEKVVETIEMAIAAAYKKDYGKKGQIIKAEFDLVSGQILMYQVKIVVDQSMVRMEEATGEENAESKKPTAEEDEMPKLIRFNPEKHILIEETKDLKGKLKQKLKRDGKEISIWLAQDNGKKIGKNIKLEDEIWFRLQTHESYGRIAAQTAKQVIIQRIREAEREAVYDEYKEKERQVISGIIQRIERGVIFFDIGRATGLLFPEEQITQEFYKPGQRMRLYVLEVQKDPKGPGIILSRAHPQMVSRLFEIEVPEITAGTVKIQAIAREAGSRSKIAVVSEEEGVDPIGSCVGQKGTRVQAVINELGGEKIDIIEWSKDPVKFISNALAPAKVLDVELDEKIKAAKVQVPEDQLSLAIGKKGQNVRLAAKLTGWRIDILTPPGEKVEVEKKKGDKVKKEKTTTKPSTFSEQKKVRGKKSKKKTSKGKKQK